LYAVTDDVFFDYFEQFGKVVDSVVMYDRVTNRSRGFGFVTFEDSSVALSVIEMAKKSDNKLVIKGRSCEVKVAYPKPFYPSDYQQPPFQSTRRNNLRGMHNNNVSTDFNHSWHNQREMTSSSALAAPVPPTIGAADGVNLNLCASVFDDTDGVDWYHHPENSFGVDAAASPYFYPGYDQQPPVFLQAVNTNLALTTGPEYYTPCPGYYGYDNISTALYCPGYGYYFAELSNGYSYDMNPALSAPTAEAFSRSISNIPDLAIDDQSTTAPYGLSCEDVTMPSMKSPIYD
jgi:RNA recognition motif-containing protein